MEQKQIYTLFSILRSVFHSNQMSNADKQLITDDLIIDVVKLASKHDVAHLVALGVLNNNLVDEQIKSQLQQIIFRAIYRYEKINYEFQRVCEALEKAEIPFIPLKGSVIRNYYPEPWMRTSCDIDILVHERDLKPAILYLVNNTKYVERGQSSHDVSLFSENGVHIELHYDLVEEARAGSSSQVLASIWDIVTAKEGQCYYYLMPDEMFYFYHIAHMAKHFEAGGCGIRPFIDLWLLDNMNPANEKKRDSVLKRGDLLKFAVTARKVAAIWMDNSSHDEVTSKMENYILKGGVYGSLENSIELQQQKKGGKIKYIFSKVFIPYSNIKFIYPILQKHRWLTPFMQVHRWCRLVFGSRAKRTMRELSYNKNVSKSQSDQMKKFLDEIGL